MNLTTFRDDLLASNRRLRPAPPTLAPLRPFAVIALAGALAACSGAALPDEPDPGTSATASSEGAQAGGAGAQTPGGAASSSSAATGPCAPQNAVGVGACRAIVAVAWNGSECVPLSGCRCEGPDCADASEERCNAIAAKCGAPEPAPAPEPSCDRPGPRPIHDCNPTTVMCRMATPQCKSGFTPSVVNGCWGPCVPAETCRCTGADKNECPDSYVCWRHVFACGPYTR